MARQPQKPRIQFTPKPELRALLEKLSAMQGKSMAVVASELLDEVAPVIQGQIQAMEAIVGRPEKAQEAIQDYALKAVNDISQSAMDFGKPGKKRGRKNGTA